jgi:hypothetical protein
MTPVLTAVKSAGEQNSCIWIGLAWLLPLFAQIVRSEQKPARTEHSYGKESQEVAEKIK